MEDDIFSLAKSKNENKIIVICGHKDFDINSCDDHGVALTHLSCRYGLIEVAKFLTEKGINFNSSTNSDDTPLHIAVQFSQNEIIDILLKLPILIDTKNCHGNTPLHYSCFWANKDVAFKLIKLGCNITTRNDQNQTPLDLAPLQLAEELAKEYNKGNYKLGLLHQSSRFKFCAKAINMALFELDIDAKLDDAKFSDIICKNVLEEKWNAQIKNRKIVLRKVLGEKDKKLITSIFVQEFHATEVKNEKMVVSSVGCFYTPETVWIVQPHFELGGILYGYLRNHRTHLTKDVLISFAIDVCQAMKYLQVDAKLLNRFVLSPRNILITDNMDAKLNLGQCAYSFQDKNKIVDPQFYSSEALTYKNGAYDKYNSDIWSFGILLSELFSTSLPDYDNMNHMHIGYKISVLKEAPKYEIHETQIEKIVQLCLNPVSSKRPQFQQLIPILTKIKELLYEK